MVYISIIFYLLLADAVIAVCMAFSGKQAWWQTHLGIWAKHFPLARGWTLYYLLLVSLLGWVLQSSNNLVIFW